MAAGIKWINKKNKQKMSDKVKVQKSASVAWKAIVDLQNLIRYVSVTIRKLHN